MISKQTAIHFIFGLLFNQSQSSEKAWKAPKLLKERLQIDIFDLEELKELPAGEFHSILAKKPALHRFPKKISEYLFASIQIICNNFKGDPRNLWNTCDCEQITQNILSLKGIGKHKAIQALIILKEMGLEIDVPESYYQHMAQTCESTLSEIQKTVELIKE